MHLLSGNTEFYSAVVNGLVEFFLGIPENALVTHEMVASQTGVSERGVNYLLVRRARKKLEQDHRVFIATVFGKGYRKALPENAVDLCHGQMVRGVRQIGRGLRRMKSVDLDALPEAKRQEVHVMSQRFGNIYAMGRQKALV